MTPLWVFLLTLFSIKSIIALPRDVEVIGEETFEQKWDGDEPESFLEAKSVQKTGILKTFRNKRSPRYHVLPSNGLHSHFEDLDIGNNENNYVGDENFWKNFKRSVDANEDDNMDITHYMEKLAIAHLTPRKKRDVIEEEKYYDAKTGKKISAADVSLHSTTENIWFPRQVNEEDEDIETLTKKTPTNKDIATTLVPPPSALALQDRREARGTQDQQWIKINFSDRQTISDQDSSPSSSLISNEEMSARMPRVNFITQNKRLDTSESRNDGDNIPRAAVSRTNTLGTHLRAPEYNNDRGRGFNPRFFQREPQFHPYEIGRRNYPVDGYYEDLSRIGTDEYYSREPPYYYDQDDRRYGRLYESGYRDRLSNNYDLYDRPSTNFNKNRRIIYYTTLPEVARTPPNVDLRYKYDANNPYLGYDENRDLRGRYDGFYRGRYYRQPHDTTKKPDISPRPRDSAVSSSVSDDKITNKNIRKDQSSISRDEMNRRSRDGNLNSHQYPINLSTSVNVDENIPVHNGIFSDVARTATDYHRYDHPSFAAPIDDPFANRRD